MITTGDIEDILIRDLRPFGIITYKKDAIPEGKVTSERIDVIPKNPIPGKTWIKRFVEINFCVPDIRGLANTKRLTELEGQAVDMRSVAFFKGSTYRYKVYSNNQEKDTALEYHFVNVSILFEILNVR